MATLEPKQGIWERDINVCGALMFALQRRRFSWRNAYVNTYAV